MALVNLGTNTWLFEYESCNKLQREIMEQLSLRNKEPKTSNKYLQLSATIRIRLKQFNNELEQLNQKLKQDSETATITSGEIERRSRLIEILRSKSVHMQKLFENNSNTLSAERNRLIGNVEDVGTASWDTDDDDILNSPIDDQSIETIRIQHKKIEQDQEKGLEELSKIISRQKNIAHAIGTEVDLHNEIIDDLGEQISRTDTRVADETQHVSVVGRKDKTCGYWLVIILLFISIIVVAIV